MKEEKMAVLKEKEVYINSREVEIERFQDAKRYLCPDRGPVSPGVAFDSIENWDSGVVNPNGLPYGDMYEPIVDSLDDNVLNAIDPAGNKLFVHINGSRVELLLDEAITDDKILDLAKDILSGDHKAIKTNQKFAKFLGVVSDTTPAVFPISAKMSNEKIGKRIHKITPAYPATVPITSSRGSMNGKKRKSARKYLSKIELKDRARREKIKKQQ